MLSMLSTERSGSAGPEPFAAGRLLPFLIVLSLSLTFSFQPSRGQSSLRLFADKSSSCRCMSAMISIGHSDSSFPLRFRLVRCDKVPRLAGRGDVIALLCMSRKERASKPAISSGRAERSLEDALMTVKSAYSHHFGPASASDLKGVGEEDEACGEKVVDCDTSCMPSAILAKAPLEFEGWYGEPRGMSSL